uniref:CX domain-containing protein n=1 Tax=Caenorhabditis tropicalis TaxID=1561998 RepID=A0A1I7TY55_9PELO
MNCAPFEDHLHEIPSPNISIAESERIIYLYDYECVPDKLREWCVGVPGRGLRFPHVLEKRFGHSMKMEFVCNREIEAERKQGTLSYGIAISFLVSASLWTMRKYRNNQRNLQETRFEDSPLNHPPFKQDPNFLTVPLRVRLRTKNPKKPKMEHESEYNMRSLCKALKPTIKVSANHFVIPKIIVYPPNE